MSSHTDVDKPAPSSEAELLEQLIDRVPTSALILGQGGDILHANSQLCSLLRCARETLLAQELADLLTSVTDSDQLRQYLASVSVPPESDRRLELRAQLRRPDGCEISALIQLSPFATEGKSKIFVFVQDITDQLQHAYLLNAIATHDDLTGLPNRAQLPDLLAHQRTRCERGALLLIDLDRFRRVNESFGHDLGDLLFIAVCARLREHLPDGAALARFSGDVLVAMVGDLDRTRTATLCESLLAATREPVLINDWDYTQGLSVGATFYPDDGDEVGQLIRKADLALGRAKAAGGSAYAFYDNAIAERVERRHTLLHLLRKAIQGQELSLSYQPRVDLRSGSVTGCEALLRWHCPSEGEISPAEMIPVAEESGLILEIGDWVMREAIRQQGRWRRQGLASGVMAVNLSTRQLRMPELPRRIEALLIEHEVPTEELELEITESSLMEDVNVAEHVLAELSRMGVRLAVDDFGTGYSSLAYLRSFPLSRLKIDQSFVRALGSDTLQESIARAIIALARALDLSVVAEGVETETQLRFLLDNDCEEIQGFLFSRALPVEDYEALLHERRGLTIRDAHGAPYQAVQG